MTTPPRYQLSRRRFLRLAGRFSLGIAAVPLLSACNNRFPRFGVVTDSHYAERPVSGTRHYAGVRAKMREAMAFFNEAKVDFVIHLGDLKDETLTPTEAETLGFLRTIESDLATFRGDRYHVLGNHDVDSITKAQFLANVTNSGIPEQTGHYAFTRGHFRFIVLDACYTPDGTPYAPGNFIWDKCYLPPSQLDWLRDEITATDKPVVVFIHQLLDDRDEPGFVVQNAAEARAVLEASGQVAAVFQGHRHEELYHEINGVHYYTFNGMVDGEGLDNNSFSVVTATPQGITIAGYKRSRDFSMDG